MPDIERRRVARLLLLAIGLSLVAAASSAQPTDGFFDSGGVQIHYSDEGSGEPVVLIHGAGGYLEQWDELGIRPALVEANYRVIALDLRGAGRSGRTPLQAPVAETARDVVRLLDHLAVDKAHVVGYGLGGHVALWLLAQQPTRVLTATLGGSGLRRSIRFPPGLSSSQSATWREGWLVDAAVLQDNAIPGLVLVGERDAHATVEVQALAAVTPNLRVIEIPGADHLTAVSHPLFLSTLERFLAEHRSQEPTPVVPH